jgi:hypothetical protein
MRLTLRALPLISLFVVATACERGFPEAGGAPSIADATFVQAMVDFRTEALNWEEGHIPEEVRDSILVRHGILGNDLVTYVEVWGSDVPHMYRVWAAVDSTLQARIFEVQPLENPGDLGDTLGVTPPSP